MWDYQWTNFKGVNPRPRLQNSTVHGFLDSSINCPLECNCSYVTLFNCFIGLSDTGIAITLLPCGHTSGLNNLHSSKFIISSPLWKLLGKLDGLSLFQVGIKLLRHGISIAWKITWTKQRNYWTCGEEWNIIKFSQIHAHLKKERQKENWNNIILNNRKL